MDLHAVLQAYWGHDEFREGQEVTCFEIASSVVIFQLLTGSG